MIVPLKKVTICGVSKEKADVLSSLQDLGCLHVLNLRGEAAEKARGGASSGSREALRFILQCPQRRRQVRDPAKFDAASVEKRVLEVKNRIHELDDERDFLRTRIGDLRPWGDFSYPLLEDLAGWRLWFYVVPHHMEAKIPPSLVWEIVGVQGGCSYIVVVSREEPDGMPVPRTRTGSRPLGEIEDRFEEVELELEDLQAERASLTRWCGLFSRSIHSLEDSAERMAVAKRTHDEDELFVLQAFAPTDSMDAVAAFTADKGLVLDVVDPEPTETPPTLCRNPEWIAAGEDLVAFYTTPSYWVWDTSKVVFLSFALFFGIILGDAGYALLLGLGLAAGWGRMGRTPTGARLRVLFAALAGSTALWGILLGNYFGIDLKAGSILGRLRVFDLKNDSEMMRLVILMGAAHLIIGNAALAWRRRKSVRALAPAGWVVIFTGGVVVYLAMSFPHLPAALKIVGFAFMALGGVGVLLFSHTDGSVGKRLMGGLHGLTNVSAAFGDTLSYLRLFALVLASASLAMTFNGLAAQIYRDSRIFGVLLAMLILVVGHGLNILLGVSGGFIHGLRLNFIEFFKWAIPEEGIPFQTFARKENSSWTE